MPSKLQWVRQSGGLAAVVKSRPVVESTVLEIGISTFPK